MFSYFVDPKVEDIVLTVYNIPFIFDYFILTSTAFGNLEQLVRSEVDNLMVFIHFGGYFLRKYLIDCLKYFLDVSVASPLQG